MTTLEISTDLDISVEDDPTPFVLSIGHVVRVASRDAASLSRIDELRRKSTCVVIDVAGTPRSATLTFDRSGVSVSHVVPASHCCQLSVDANARYSVTASHPADVDDDLVYDISQLLNPPIAEWTVAASEFWDLTGRDVGMPGTLTVVCTATSEHVVLGSGESKYEIHGDAVSLARLFAGIDSFVDSVVEGRLKIAGTMAHLSVIAGASWKVQHNV